MRQIEFLGIAFDETARTYQAIAEITEDDGKVFNFLQVFPYETIEWRMAEYGATVEEAVDMVLHEPFASSEDDNSDPNFLYNAASIEDSKAWHLARCRAHKEDKRPKISKAASSRRSQARALALKPEMVLEGDDPYAALAAHVRPDAEVLEVIRQHVERQRNQKFQARNQSRADQIRERLGMVDRPAPRREDIRGNIYNQAAAKKA